MATIPIRNFVLSTTPRRRPALSHHPPFRCRSALPNSCHSFRRYATRIPLSRCTEKRQPLGNDRSNIQNCGMTQETIARLRISLNDIEPAVWRIVEMPVAGSLKMLHDVIQAAMGWQNYHLWHFEAGERRYGMPDPK